MPTNTDELQGQGVPDGKDADLLKEIRENFDYSVNQWASIRDEAAIDMRCIGGDAWDPDERDKRENADRLCLTLDELSQYTNQLINNVRQNKRGVKVEPRGNGANDQTAELRQGKIREIEQRSNAQAAYICMFENAVNRSYGVLRITKEYDGEKSFNQELRIKRMPNPDAVYFDADSKERDCSDGNFAFVIDAVRRTEYKRRFPRATITDFTDALIQLAPRWISERDVQIAEYWRKERAKRQLIMFERGIRLGSQLPPDQAPEAVFLDELGDGVKLDKRAVVDGAGNYLGQVTQRPNGNLVTRDSESIKIVQYITNGLEILERNPWDGKYIPLVPCFGKELYIDKGKGPERVLMSLVRLARDPYMLYCYYRTCEAEIVGMAPKAVWVGYEGQFEGHEDEWKDANVSPLPYLQAKPMIDAATGQMLPLPQRNTFEPPIQALELGAEAARRGIQAAIGGSPLPTQAQRHNEKSGVALQQIEATAALGSFHFVDNYDASITLVGKILDDLLPYTYDTARETAIVKSNDEREMRQLNQPVPDPNNPGQTIVHSFEEGDHEVSISTGPNFDTMRDEANATADLLLNNQLFAPRVGWLAIKLKNLGPIGDEIASLITPPDVAAKQNQGMIPAAQAQQQIAQLQQQLGAVATDLKQKLSVTQLQLSSKERIEALHAYVEIMVEAMKVGSQEALQAASLEAQRLESMFDRAHEVALQAHAAAIAPEPEPEAEEASA